MDTVVNYSKVCMPRDFCRDRVRGWRNGGERLGGRERERERKREGEREREREKERERERDIKFARIYYEKLKTIQPCH